MKIRKLVSLGLAVIMLLSVSAQIFAAEETPANTTVFTSTYSEPDIDVTVPKTGAVALNPLGLDVDLSGEGEAAQIIKGQQIVTTPSIIVNNSTMNLEVSVSIESKAEGGLKLVANEMSVVGYGTDPDAGANKYQAAATSNSAFAVFEMLSTTLTDPDDEEAINKAAAKWAYAYKETVTEGKTVSDGLVVTKDANFKGVILEAGSSGAAKTVKSDGNLVTLKAASDGDPVSGSIALMRISGKMVKSPSTAWATTHKLISTVTFTFSPA